MRIRRIAANDFKQLQSIDIHLPRVGRFLVQGRNEAGKSTLFEALYYGLFARPLVGRSTDDLIGYGRERAWIEVWIETQDALFKVQRTLIRGKSQQVTLVIEREGRTPETVSGANAVVRIIEQELKLDGDALLNTCFVEQKKLDKLEGVDRARREASLMKLLNLERLTTISEECKVGADDRERLRRLEMRLDLARVRDELPAVEARAREVDERLTLARAQAALESTLREQAACDTRAAEAARLAARAAQLTERWQASERVKAAGQALKALMEHLRTMDETRQERDRQAAVIRERQAAVAELPTVEARARRLRRLDSRSQRLAAVARRQETLHRLAGDREREAAEARLRREDLAREMRTLARLDADLAAAEVAVAAAEAVAAAWAEHEALGGWRDVYQAATAPERASREGDDLRQEQAARRAEMAALLDKLRETPTATIVADLAALVADLERIAHRLGYLAGSAETLRQRAEADKKRLTAATRKLTDLGVTVPVDGTAADARLAELAAQVAGRDGGTLQREVAAARDTASGLRAERGIIARKARDLEADLAGYDDARVEQAAQIARVQADKANAVLARWQPRLSQALTAAAVDGAGLTRACHDADVAAVTLRRQADEVADMQVAARRLDERLIDLEMGVEGLLAEVEQTSPDALLLRADLQVDALGPKLAELRASYKALDGQAAQEERAEVIDAGGRAREAAAQAEQRRDAALDTARAELRQARLLHLLGDEDADTLTAARDELATFGLDRVALEGEREALREQVSRLRLRRDTLTADLGLADQELDVAVCEAELAAHSRDIQVRERARAILDAAQRSIMNKILPRTMDHMATILPELTSSRYKMAHLGDDYKIRVWDERAGDAGGWRQKDIFSGGARDQLSLALRLSFALATLPEERGAAPSFIFLDEPLGAFDDERAGALLHLLTEGEVGKNFDQIFLISHVRVDPSAFTYRILMEGGRVAEHDLPDVGTRTAEGEGVLAGA